MLQPSLAAEKIKVEPIFKSSKVPSGKNFNYLEGKPELKLKTFKSTNFSWIENSKSYLSFPNIDLCYQRKIKTCEGLRN